MLFEDYIESNPLILPDSNWTKYYDNEGKAYYYEKVSKTTQRKLPDIYLEWKNEEFEKFIKSTNWRRQKNDPNASTFAKYPFYYYDKVTRQTQWKMPLELQDFMKRLDESISDKITKTSKKVKSIDIPSNASNEISFQENLISTNIETEKNLASEIPEVDLVKEKSDLLNLITLPDFILEDNSREILQKLIIDHKENPMDIISQASESYVGQPHMTHILSEWILLGNHFIENTSSAHLENLKSGQFELKTHDTEIESILYDQLRNLVKTRFHNSRADELVGPSKSVPVFLTDMINDFQCRKLLIELFDSNRDSVVLRWCLRQISLKGCHREIAQGIRESDFFDIFNDLFVSMIVSVLSPQEDSVKSIVDDLKRMCYHSDYVFVYSQEVLLELELNFDSRLKSFDSLNILNSEEANNTNNSPSDHSSIRKRKFFEGGNLNTQDMSCKIRRLRQELEEAAIWRITAPDETVPTATANSALLALDHTKSLDSGSSFALRYTLLYHPSLDSDPQFTSFVREVTDILKRNAVDAIHVQRICSFLIGCELSAPDSDLLLSSINHSKLLSLISKLRDSNYSPISVLSHPKLLNLFLDALIHPKKKLPGTNMKTALIISIVCLLHKDTKEDSIESHIHNLSSMCKSILSCKDIILDLKKSMISKELIEKTNRLRELVRYPVLSVMFFRWSQFTLLEEDIYFFDILPVYLELVQEISLLQIVQHPECLKILKLTLSNISNKILDRKLYNKLVIDCLDCIINLMAAGYAIQTLNYLTSLASTFDVEILSHFIISLMTSIEPPYSFEFQRSISAYLNLDCNKKALADIYSPTSSHDANIINVVKAKCDYILLSK